MASIDGVSVFVVSLFSFVSWMLASDPGFQSVSNSMNVVGRQWLQNTRATMPTEVSRWVDLSRMLPMKPALLMVNQSSYYGNVEFRCWQVSWRKKNHNPTRRRVCSAMYRVVMA